MPKTVRQAYLCVIRLKTYRTKHLCTFREKIIKKTALTSYQDVQIWLSWAIHMNTCEQQNKTEHTVY